jgi:hypothetical protein
MHEPINVKSPNNTSKWQMGFNSAFKGLIPQYPRLLLWYSVNCTMSRAFQYTWFHTSVATRCKWDFHSPYVTQRTLVDSKVWSHFQGARPLKMGLYRLSRSLGNYLSELHNIPEERRPYFVHCSEFMPPLFKVQPKLIKLLKCKILTIACYNCQHLINTPLLFSHINYESSSKLVIICGT